MASRSRGGAECLGKCGRCNTGESYVCKDGPVYTLEQLESLPAEY